MKKTFVTLIAICIAVITLHAFRSASSSQTAGIKGTIVPADAASWVWAISGTDTVKAAPVKGSFVLAAKAGAWRVIVDANDPYKDAILERVEVKEGQVTDVGEVKLPQ